VPSTRSTVRIGVAVATAAVAVVALAAPQGATAAAPRFSKPVLLTVDANAGGYEPGIVVDKFGNIVVTAHKQNHTLVLSPDSRSTTKLRSMSWVWWSHDNGKTFADMPGLTPAGEQNAEFGDEGDLTWDATGHVYFVDTNVGDVTFSRWKASGKGELALEATRPLGPMGEPVDDRPWITAHGDGVVMYLGNEGGTEYPGGQPPAGGAAEAANGPGRYTIYMSYDHGDTFNNLGYTLKGSGWCRPITDHRPAAAASKTFVVVCSNDTDTHYSYVTHDDGKHWTRYTMGKYSKSSWINGAVAKDGTIYAMYHDTDDDKMQHLMLYTSKNGGKTWTKRDVTQGRPGAIAYSWMDVSPNGTIGIAYYGSPDGKKSWYMYAGTAKPGQRLTYGKVSPGLKLAPDGGFVWGDFFQVAFGPDDKLNVVFTTDDNIAGQASTQGLNSQIWYARQL
jgi:hypothetical protein